jgi:CelD/BcsL family acetyltransferase involved in cellulose biosynthesis
LQAVDPSLSSPFLAPEFTLTVAGARANVMVAVLEQNNRPVGFFPYERGLLSAGYQVGGTLNDLQGVVAAPGVDLPGSDLIRRCGLIQWRFNRILASQQLFEPHHVRTDVSWLIDLTAGFDAYASDKQDRFGSRLLRKGRRLERERGPVRFELHNAEPTSLAQLMAWKSARYATAGYIDVFRTDWARQVIERIHATQTDSFAGLLSLLWAGDDLVAAHLGIRCLDRWHSWIISYAPEFARYSPGLLLYWNLAKAANGAGVRRIEIGGGDYAYKRMLANSSIGVAGGSVDRIPLVANARRLSEESRRWIRASPLLRPPARTFFRTCRRMIRAATP